ncbi:MAG TPA: beta-galactosidase [Saprospiraceae bacterium]|nr:beta-galactosidase [Saprospiraceae bacterium]
MIRKIKNLFLLGLICWMTISIHAQPHHSFTYDKDKFYLDGAEIQLIAGELHPARIPETYWLHRIRMAKAMGCNAISMYDFWNFHEEKEGLFDFLGERKNTARFIRLCQDEGMWVLFRPGPYVCGEWDLGGLPPYLLKDKNMALRSDYAPYMSAVERYFKVLAEEITPLLITRGGPIIMLQIENEYGSYANDHKYLRHLEKIWRDLGVDVPFYTADGPAPYMLEAGNLPNFIVGLNSGNNEKDFNTARQMNPNMPALSTETYPGWLTHWGEDWARPDTTELKNAFIYQLTHGRSVVFYVLHGGTNFGFTAGANGGNPTAYQPDITSYDYDAPISENGLPTTKYYMLRRLVEKYKKVKLPPVPEPIMTMEIPSFAMNKTSNLFNYKFSSISSPMPLTMEQVNQNHGLIMYKTRLIGHHSGTLRITEPHDYALIYLDGKYQGNIQRDGGKWEIKLPKTDTANPELLILVEAMGRNNYGQYMTDRKGITDKVTLNGMILMDWEISSIPFDNDFISGIKNRIDTSALQKECTFYTGTFNLDKTADTFFDLSNYQKGYLFVNGHHLGRFWNIGPQQRLYCPADYLKEGVNELLVFDFYQQEPMPVSGKKNLTE